MCELLKKIHLEFIWKTRKKVTHKFEEFVASVSALQNLHADAHLF